MGGVEENIEIQQDTKMERNPDSGLFKVKYI